MNTPIILDDIDFSVNYHHFNPEEIQTDETINCVFVVDISPSVGTYIKDLNHAFSDFVSNMQQSHLAGQLLVSVTEFNEQVLVKTGFQPIGQLPQMIFAPSGGGTALYDATLRGVRQAIDYRATLETSGVQAKTLVFVITDGEDNSSSHQAADVKAILDRLKADERTAFSFTTVLFGVGSAAAFGKARQDMGIQHLATVGTSGAEIKRMIGLIQNSVSSTASGHAISF